MAKMENLNKIREIRKSQGHTLHSLSEMMGVSASALEKVEKGERRLKQYFIARAAQVLKVDPHELANGQEIDQEARITPVVNKPGLDQPNILQSRSIRVYHSMGMTIPKDQAATYIACPSTVWADENSFAVSIPVVPEEVESVVPWLTAGTVCFASNKAPFRKGGLVVVETAGQFILAQIESFTQDAVKVSTWVGNKSEVAADKIYPVVTINLR